jgi:hypothetical protein
MLSMTLSIIFSNSGVPVADSRRHRRPGLDQQKKDTCVMPLLHYPLSSKRVIAWLRHLPQEKSNGRTGVRLRPLS